MGFFFGADMGWRGTAIAVLAASLLGLSGCGGGGGSGGATPVTAAGNPDGGKVTASVDPALLASGSLVLASTMSLVDTRPIGTPLTTQGASGAVIYGVDAAGNIALAANIVDGQVVFSAESTVLAMAATVLQGVIPGATQEQLQTRLKAADGFAALVTDIRAAVVSGKNPLDLGPVQQGFDKVLASALRATLQVQPAVARALAVAPKHTEDSYEPSVFETATFKVSVANSSSGVLKFDSGVYLRNTSAVFFDVALLDASDVQRADGLLDGAGASIFSLNGALPTKIDKPFGGAFSVRLAPNDDKNKAAMIKGVMSLFKLTDDACINALFKVGNDKLIDVSFGKAPLEWTNLALASAAWKGIEACALPNLTSETVDKVFKAYTRITKLVGIGRLAADRMEVPESIPDTGVCLSEGQYLMNCVSLITADEIKPMMPGAVQPIDVLLLDDQGKKTRAPPYGLKIEYSNPGLFELTPSMTQVIAGASEGSGTLKITDPATDNTFSMRITVTKGKLAQAAYAVPVNGAIEVKLVDPASGIEVFRNPATFSISLPVTTYGSFNVSTPYLSGIEFRASAAFTPSAQPILLGAMASGSTMSVGEKPGMLGDALTVSRRYPTVGSLYADWHPASLTAIVDEGPSDMLEFKAGIQNLVFALVNPEANDIHMSLVEPSIYLTTGSVFDGFVLTGFRHPIKSATIALNQTGMAVTIDHTETEIQISMAGAYSSNAGLTIHVEFDQ